MMDGSMEVPFALVISIDRGIISRQDVLGNKYTPTIYFCPFTSSFCQQDAGSGNSHFRDLH
jgi:hypothetical protein